MPLARLTGSRRKSYLAPLANTDMQESSHLRLSRERLERAVERLEAVLEAGPTAQADAARALAEAEAENAGLKRINQTVSTRLDAAIGRLKAVLEE